MSTPSIFYSCNALTSKEYPTANPVGADWNGSSFAEITMINDGDTLPDGQIAQSWKTQNGIAGAKCVMTRPYVQQDGTRWPWNVYNLFVNGWQDWNFTGNELLKVRMLTNHPEIPIGIGYASAGWTTYSYGEVQLAAKNVWQTVEIDLRGPLTGSPDLAHGNGIYFVAGNETVYINGNAGDYYLLIDYMTVELATASIALKASISPTGGRIKTSGSLALTCSPNGGTGTYNYRWYVNDVDTGVTSISYTFIGQNAGTYKIHCVVNDGASTLTTNSASITVIAQLPPPVPTRPIHCEGTSVKDDTGKTVRLQGVMPGSWLSGPFKDTFGIDGTMHYSANYTNFADEIPVIMEEIEGMRTWGFNAVRIHISTYLWVTNLSGYRDNIKTYAQLLAANGIYLIVCGYSIGYWDHALRGTPLPYPPHLSAEEIALNNSAGISWNTPQDYINWVVSAAQFLSDCNNILIETWNEPNSDSGMEPYAQCKANWLAYNQQIINAMRTAGLNQIIVVQWNYGSNYTFNSDNSAFAMDFEFTDPINNIMYSTHCYRVYSQVGIWYNGNWSNSPGAYTYDDIKAVYTDLNILATAQKHPVLIGEIGANISDGARPSNDGTSAIDAERLYLQNMFKLCRDYNMHWIGFWYRPDGIFALVVGGAQNYVPTATGSEMIAEITSPTPPIPNQNNMVALVLLAGAAALALS